MATDRPTISVVTPAYNAARHIGETLESVVAQTLPPLEIVVVDDGSTDDTVGVVERFGDRVRVVRQENRGCGAAFNRAIAEASGDYVALCPADDLWEPRKLEWQTEALDRHPEVDVAFGHARRFGLVEDEYPRPPATGLLDNDVLLPALYEHNFIADPSAVVRRELYDRIGPYREGGDAEDYEFWLRALRAGARFYYDPRLLVWFRWHGENLTMQGMKMSQSRYDIHRAFAEDVDDERHVRRVLAKDLVFMGRSRMGAGLYREGLEAFRASLRRRVTPRGAFWAALLTLPGGIPAVRAAYAGRRLWRARSAGV